MKPFLLVVGGVSGLGILTLAGIFRCPMAFLLHIPCPGCGTTRACLALFSFKFDEVLRFNPVGPFVAFLAGIFAIRAMYVAARDGHTGALSDGVVPLGLTRLFLVALAAQTIIWGFRWFGLFGGPCPV